MKNKRNAMLSLLLLVMVVSGVMYAAINGKALTINGYAHAKADDQNFKVKFVPLETEATVVVDEDGYFSEKLEGTSATITSDQTATFNIVFNKKGTQYVLLKIKNDSESLGANVTANVTVESVESQDINTNSNFDEYFSIERPIHLANGLKKDSISNKLDLDEDTEEDIDIDAQYYGYVKIPVTLTKDVVSDIGYDGSGNLSTEYQVTVTLHATPIQ